jgi:hypothetical protein
MIQLKQIDKDIEKIIINYYNDTFGELDVDFEEDQYLVELKDNIKNYIKKLLSK